MDIEHLKAQVINLYLYLGQLERGILTAESRLKDMQRDKQHTLDKIDQLEELLESISTPPAESKD